MSRKKEQIVEAAFAELDQEKTTKELDAVLTKYENKEFGVYAGKFANAYHDKYMKLADQELGNEDENIFDDDITDDRQNIWTSRIREFRAKIKEEEAKEAGAKIDVKAHQLAVKALKSELFELLDAGPENFEIDRTPLLTLMELEEKRAQKDEEVPKNDND